MIEVQARLRFTTHSLGARRTWKKDKMLRDTSGQVMFLPTWWASLMRYASKILNRHQKRSRDIDWDPVIDGQPRDYQRFLEGERFILHDAFYPGDVIGVNAVLPDSISIDDFVQLLDIAGRYRGISPYKPHEQWGRFEVLTVQRRKREVRTPKTEKTSGDVPEEDRLSV